MIPDFDYDTLRKLFMSQTKGVPAHVIVQAFHRLPYHGVSYTKCTKGMLAESWAASRARRPPHGQVGLDVELGVILSHIREIQKQAAADKERRAKLEEKMAADAAKYVAEREAAERRRERITAEHALMIKALRPFADISREGVVIAVDGHVTVTTCAEYFHRAAKILAEVTKP